MSSDCTIAGCALFGEHINIKKEFRIMNLKLKQKLRNLKLHKLTRVKK